MAVGGLALRDLRNGSGLPHTVHAHEHPHVRLARIGRERAVAGRVEELDQLVAQDRHDHVGVGDPIGSSPFPHRVEHAGGGRQADVGEEQRLLELLPGVVVDAAAAPDRGERANERGPRLAQPVAQRRRLERLPLEDLRLGRGDHLGLDDHVRCTRRGGRRSRRRLGDDAAARWRRFPLVLLGAARQAETERDQRDGEQEDEGDDEHGRHRRTFGAATRCGQSVPEEHAILGVDAAALTPWRFPLRRAPASPGRAARAPLAPVPGRACAP